MDLQYGLMPQQQASVPFLDGPLTPSPLACNNLSSQTDTLVHWGRGTESNYKKSSSFSDSSAPTILNCPDFPLIYLEILDLKHLFKVGCW